MHARRTSEADLTSASTRTAESAFVVQTGSTGAFGVAGSWGVWALLLGALVAYFATYSTRIPMLEDLRVLPLDRAAPRMASVWLAGLAIE